MTLLGTVLHPAPEHLRTLLKTGPSSQAVAALLPGGAQRLTVERVHFPGAKPVQLQIRAHDDAGHSQVLLGEWVGAQAEDLALAEAARLAKPRRGQSAMQPAVVADLTNGLVLRRPGFDAKLPGLRLLHDPAFAAERLGAQTSVSLVAHRLGKRAVLRITGPYGVRFARLRPVTSSSGQAAYDRHFALWTALQGNAALTIPRPMGFDAELGMALFERLPGVPPVFDGLAGFAACQSVMRGIAAMQSLATEAEQHSTCDELEILDVWAGRLVQVFPDMSDRVQPLLQCLRDDLTAMAPVTPALCHRDLHEGQVLLDVGRTGLLDFDTLRLGDPCLDLGNLQAHLILATLRDGIPRRAFVTALENASAHRLARVALLRRAALLRLAMIYAFSAEPKAVILGLLAEAA
jgi:aminoglycoside phosphotransferase (APT) family kinase protein